MSKIDKIIYPFCVVWMIMVAILYGVGLWEVTKWSVIVWIIVGALWVFAAFLQEARIAVLKRHITIYDTLLTSYKNHVTDLTDICEKAIEQIRELRGTQNNNIVGGDQAGGDIIKNGDS